MLTLYIDHIKRNNIEYDTNRNPLITFLKMDLDSYTNTVWPGL